MQHAPDIVLNWVTCALVLIAQENAVGSGWQWKQALIFVGLATLWAWFGVVGGIARACLTFLRTEEPMSKRAFRALIVLSAIVGLVVGGLLEFGWFVQVPPLARAAVIVTVAFVGQFFLEGVDRMGGKWSRDPAGFVNSVRKGEIPDDD